MWTNQNTEGFSADELAMINRVLDRIAADADGIDQGNRDDAINNAWRGGISEAELEAETRRALGIA